jgi:hypothetical protein
MSKYIEARQLATTNIKPRLFIGLNGRLMVSDHLGVHVASALALALLLPPAHRAVGFRSEVDHG